MSLAIFDLDNTLLGGDSDHAWGEFLVNEGLVDRKQHKARNDAFYKDYQAGTLNIHDYQRFALSFLVGKSEAEAKPYQEKFFQSTGRGLILPKAIELVEEHRKRDDTLLVITATNRFVTAPIVEAFGIPHLIACEPAMVDGRYTGALEGVASFQAGKITRLNQWLSANEHLANLDSASFYSDSFNDIPLLSVVDHPVAVDPDAKLRAHAEASEWRIISLR